MSETVKELSRQQKWRKRNPKQYIAHLSVQAALRHGVIEKAPCEVCGTQKAEAHHPDYERPYDVVWLCRTHHKALHAREAVA